MDKLICVGKNYLDHAKELGDQVPALPVLFLKPPSVLRQAGASGMPLTLSLPRNAGALHHECEIVLRLDRGGSDLTREQALAAIGAVTLGLDMTLRDRQAELKKNGHPWEIGKVFRDAAVIGPWLESAYWPRAQGQSGFHAAPDLEALLKEEFRLLVNGAVRQRGRGSEMRLSAVDCVKYASQYFELRTGDLLFTGTPAGVGPVVSGDRARLEWGALAYECEWRGENDITRAT